MLNTFKSFTLLLAASLSLNYLHAQKTGSAKKSHEQSIIINKKDSIKEKITLVIDGDNVTVNGKPIDDFVSNEVDIIKHDLGDDHYRVYAGDAMPAIAPRPEIRAFQDDMVRKIKSNTAFLGVMTEKMEKGAQITEVTEGSAAEKAGLKEGDVITKIADDVITGPDDLYKVVGKHKPDEKVVVSYLRDGKPATANVVMGKTDKVKIYSWNSPDVNMLRKNFEPYDFSFEWSEKPRLGIEAQDTEDGNGVKILDVDDEDSPAAKAGLKEDDIITQINGKAVNSTDDLRESMHDVKKGDTLKLTYKRNNQTQTVDVKFPKELKTIDL